MRFPSARPAAAALAVAAFLLVSSGASAGVLNAPPSFAASSGCSGTAAFPALGGSSSVVVQATDQALQTVTLNVSGLPAWLGAVVENGNPAVATISGDPGLTEFIEQFIAGPYASFTVTASDNLGAQSTCTLTPIVTLFGFA